MEPEEKKQGFWSRVWNAFLDRLAQLICGAFVGFGIAFGILLIILRYSAGADLISGGPEMPRFFHIFWIFPLLGGVYGVCWGHQNRYRPARKKGENNE
jgi:hypothetical protein